MTTDTHADIAPTSPASVAASEWFVRAHVAQLLDNPTDVRGGDRDQTPLVEMAGSIRDAGVLKPSPWSPSPVRVTRPSRTTRPMSPGSGCSSS